MLHCAVYCGVPAANHAFSVAQDVLRSMEDPANDVFLYDALRTPFGRYGGALAQVRPDDLAAGTLGRSSSEVPGWIDGHRRGRPRERERAGEDNRNVARTAALLAGLPVTVPASTGNRLCGSSLDATIVGARRSPSASPASCRRGCGVHVETAWVSPKPDKPFPVGNAELVSTALGWRLTDPAMPSAWTVSLGEATEQLRERQPITGKDQDVFALRSHESAARAWAGGSTGTWSSTCQVTTCGVTSRSGRRPPRRAHADPVLRHDGTVTAGNASPLSDGASAASLGDASAAGSSDANRSPASRAGHRPRTSHSSSESRAQAADVALGEQGSPGGTSAPSSQRGVRRRVPRLRSGVGVDPASSTDTAVPSPSATPSAPPHPDPRHPREDAPHHARPLGRGGHLHRVGQGLAVVLENAATYTATGCTPRGGSRRHRHRRDLMIGGSGAAGQPVELIDADIASGASRLTVVNNTRATETSGWQRDP